MPTFKNAHQDYVYLWWDNSSVFMGLELHSLRNKLSTKNQRDTNLKMHADIQMLIGGRKMQVWSSFSLFYILLCVPLLWQIETKIQIHPSWKLGMVCIWHCCSQTHPSRRWKLRRSPPRAQGILQHMTEVAGVAETLFPSFLSACKPRLVLDNFLSSNILTIVSSQGEK